MGQHIIDTQIKLAKCVRCGAYVFACDVAGLRVMADPEPLDADGVRAALCASLDVWRVLTVAGRPHKLQKPSLGALSALDQHTLIAGHGCGVSGRDAARVEDVPVPKASASVTHGAPQAGHPRQSHPAPAVMSASSKAMTKDYPSVARHATPPLSDSPCWECGGDVTEEPYVGLSWDGTWEYLRHDECGTD